MTKLLTDYQISHKTKMGLKLTTSLLTAIWIGCLITGCIIQPATINQWFQIVNPEHNWQFYSMKIYLILIVCLLLIASLLLTTITYQATTFNDYPNHLWLTGFLALISGNVYWLGLVIKTAYQQTKLVPRQNWWGQLQQRLGIKRWITKDYVLIAIFVSLTIVCAFLEEVVLPHLPFGGGFGLKYIPLMALSFSTNFMAGWLCGFVTAFVSLLFIPASNIISPWSFLFDYFLPLTTPALVALLSNKITKRHSLFTYLTYFCHCFLVLLLIYVWQVIVGYFIWVQVYPTSVWKGYQPLLYSLVYNFIHIFIFTFPLMLLTIPVIYRTLSVIKQN